jgi:hypothetical protein
MAHFSGGSTTNFGTSVTGQANSFWVPEVFSKKILNFFRKSSIAEAVTNTDYYGEISNFGDTVNIIREPNISVEAYTRGLDLTAQTLTDAEVSLLIDKANAYEFRVDELEKSLSHMNWAQLATSSAAYNLKDAFDADVLQYMSGEDGTTTGAGTFTAADHGIGGGGVGGSSEIMSAIGARGVGNGLDVGFTSTPDYSPADLLGALSLQLDEQNIPEENRWVVAAPKFYEMLNKEDSKLMSVDYNGGTGNLRNGLVAEGKVRGFQMYKTNNAPSYRSVVSGSNNDIAGSALVMAGHMSSTASATALTKNETLRDTNTFQDIVRGLHVYGRQVVQPKGLAIAYVEEYNGVATGSASTGDS